MGEIDRRTCLYWLGCWCWSRIYTLCGLPRLLLPVTHIYTATDGNWVRVPSESILSDANTRFERTLMHKQIIIATKKLAKVRSDMPNICCKITKILYTKFCKSNFVHILKIKFGTVFARVWPQCDHWVTQNKCMNKSVHTLFSFLIKISAMYYKLQEYWF